jgi:dihydroorotase
VIALLGGHLVDPESGWDGPADIYLEAAGVVAVLPTSSATPPGDWETRDCAGLLVLPGLIDTLCRVDLDADPWREAPAAVAETAARAGYTAVLAFTGSADPRRISALTEGRYPIRFHAVAALTAGGRLADLGLLAQAGAVAFSDWPAALPHAGLLRQALEYAGGLDRPVIVHPELPELAQGGVAHESPLSFALGLRGIPAAAEVGAIARDMTVARTVGRAPHFAAISCADSLECLGPATAGVTAHHLVLTEAEVVGYRPEAKLSPPLRGDTDREALVAAARAGRLLLASGHRSCPAEEKACEYDYASFGAPGLETTPAVALAQLGALALARAGAAGPAAAFRLPGGSVRAGQPGDVTVFDAAAEWQAETGPEAGRWLRGRAVLTVVGGRVAFARGDVCIKIR